MFDLYSKCLKSFNIRLLLVGNDGDKEQVGTVYNGTVAKVGGLVQTPPEL